ncbi:MAG: response regulator [Acidobacteriota bacterium]
MARGEVVILMADDDPDDVMLVEKAFQEVENGSLFRSVENGKELLEYLWREGGFADPVVSPRPDLILLDLNMPLMNGKEALMEIKSHETLRTIPIVMLTTSSEADNVSECYCLGASAYVVKPSGFTQLIQAVQSISSFWFRLNELPSALRKC